MADPRFYVRAGPLALGELAKLTNSALAAQAAADFLVGDVAQLGAVEAGQIAYAQNAKNAASARAAMISL